MKALRENWTLALMAVVILIIALVITMFPALQAAAQTCAKSGHTCTLKKFWQCVWRGWGLRGRWVCGWMQYCYCVPDGYGRWRGW